MKKSKIFLYMMFSEFFLGIICFLLSRVIGSNVDGNGILHEPFFLIPLGYLFFIIGLISGLFYLIKRFSKSYQ